MLMWVNTIRTQFINKTLASYNKHDLIYVCVRVHVCIYIVIYIIIYILSFYVTVI